MVAIEGINGNESLVPEMDPGIKLNKVKFNEHPFQKFLDYAVDSLNSVSNTEYLADNLVKKYAAGNASLEDVMFAQNRLSIQTNIAVTAINNAVSAFKEIQQMPL